jgi:hypothetical protein
MSGAKRSPRSSRHRLIDVQAGIADEMSPFTIPTNLEKMVKLVQQGMQRRSSLGKPADRLLPRKSRAFSQKSGK